MYKTPNWVLGPNFNVCVCARERERERKREFFHTSNKQFSGLQLSSGGSQLSSDTVYPEIEKK